MPRRTLRSERSNRGGSSVVSMQSGGSTGSVASLWWNTAALYDFDFVHQRGRDVGGAANIAVGSFSTYFVFTNGAPRYGATGLLFDNTVHFDKAALGGVLATLTSGANICILCESNAGAIAAQEILAATALAGAGEMARDTAATSLGSFNGTNFLSTTLGSSASFATSNIRCMYRQTAAGRAICANGGTVATDANLASATRPWNLGSNGTNSNELNGGIRRCIIFDPATVSNAQMQSYSTGSTV